ncbi:MAG TPA: hypothetical protein VEK78_06410 [Gemmatimonadales bacterium]|nr:hypothetical protein [Gemmatimonadales bacterium]
MNKHRENRGPMSRLPEDEAYWEALTERVMTDAAGRLSAYRNAGTRLWHRLARFATPLTVGAAAAVIAAVVWLPEVGPEPTRDTSPGTPYALAPDDPLAGPFVTSAAAPTMATLMATPTLERIQ